MCMCVPALYLLPRGDEIGGTLLPLMTSRNTAQLLARLRSMGNVNSANTSSCARPASDTKAITAAGLATHEHSLFPPSLYLLL